MTCADPETERDVFKLCTYTTSGDNNTLRLRGHRTAWAEKDLEDYLGK